MKVRVSAAASVDLAGIGDWIARDNPWRAASFIGELVERCQSLSSFPERFPVARRVGRTELRKLNYHGYIILYRVHAADVEIARVLNGAQDVWAILDAMP